MKCNKARYYVSLLALSTALSLGSCAADAEESARAYAKANYGEAEYIGCENSEQGDRYIFADTEYGFNYFVSDSENVTAPLYETKPSNFSAVYLACADSFLMNEYDRIQTEYKVKLFIPDRSIDYFCFCSLMADDEDTGIKAAEALASAYQAYDTRKWWQSKGMSIEIINTNRARLGSYYYDGKRYVSKEESTISFYTNYVHQHIDKQATYKEKTVVSIDDFASTFETVPDFTGENWDIGNVVTIYYFISGDGSDIFVADAFYLGNPCVLQASERQ